MARTALSIAAALLTACGGTGADATPVGACGAEVNGCSVFTDLTATTATIGFTSFAYTPACAEVKVGQAVTFVGDFGFHPISQTCGPVEAITIFGAHGEQLHLHA